MTNFNDQAKQAFTAVSDWSKQLLTLSTAVLTVTITFADKFFKLSPGEKDVLWVAMVLYLVSVLAGVMVLGGIAGQLTSDDPGPRAVYESGVRLPSTIQVATFALATAAVVVFGFMNVGDKDPSPTSTTIPTMTS